MKIKVLLADDQEIVLRGLRMNLALETDLEIVAAVYDGLEAIDHAKRHRPDVIVMDVEMPHMDGITAAQTLRTELPDAAVVFLSMYDSTEVKERALKAGAFAFIPKHAPPDALIDTIRRAARGHVDFPQER